MNRLKCYLLVVILCLWQITTAQEASGFSIIPASVSGIDFSNEIKDIKEHSILQYSNYYGGGGVGIGDLDNDGYQDIYLAGNLVGDRVYKNIGGLKFEDKTHSAGIVDDGSWSSGVIIADFDHDGWNDIYVTCELYDDSPALRKNKLYINKGNFQFKESGEEFELDNTERTRGGCLVDYNLDGFVDILLLNQPPNPGNYSKFSGQNLLQEKWSPKLYKNLEGRRFVDVTQEANIDHLGYANSAVSADINNDGWPDIYIAHDYDAPDLLYINQGDGSFREIIKEATGHISYFSMGVDIADVNNDNWLDIMTLDMVAEDNYRQKANMGGMYPEQFWKLVNSGGHYQYMFNALQLNQGNERFSNIAQMAGVSNTDWSWSTLIADFDNDGWKDIHVTNGLLRDIRNTDMSRAFPDYVLELATDYIKAYPDASEVPILDIMDIDKALDMHPSIPLANYAFRNNGDLSFEQVQEDWSLDQKSFSNGSAYGDLDNDGDLDLVINNINQEAFLYENLTGGKHYLRFDLIDTISNRTCLHSRVIVYSDGAMQTVELSPTRGMYSTSESVIHFGLGKATSADSVWIRWNNGMVQKLYDVVGGQELSIQRPILTKPEILTISHQNTPIRSTESLGIDFVHQENDFNDFHRQVLIPHKMSQWGPAIAVGDINDDGLDDIFLGGAAGQSGELYLQKKGQFFKTNIELFQTDSAYEDIDATFVDFDGDQDLDLYVVSGGNHRPSRNKHYLDRLYENDGSGNFISVPQSIPRLLESGSCVRPYDFDDDGDLDLFVGGRHNPWDYPSPSISRLLENVDGKYTDITKVRARDLIFNGLVTDAIWQDYNADGYTDLIVVGEWMPVTFYKNEGSSLVLDSVDILVDGEKMNTEGWWQHIKSIDIDHDGDLDLICGNLGTNYKYKANQDEPFEVYYDDFDDNGSKDIVLSYYNFGTQYPLRGRSCSAEQIPLIKKQFPSYDLFAQADLQSVYGSDKLSEALHLKAYMFRHVVLYNEGTHYRLMPLPNELQLSQINASAVWNDGKVQYILVAGNMNHSEIETPKNDASYGSLIRIDQKGETEIISPQRSNLYLTGDVRKIKLINIDGHPFLIVAKNNDHPSLISITELQHHE